VRQKVTKLKCNREKLLEALLYKKRGSKMLIKSTPGVNYIYILCTRFLYKSALHSFSLVMFWRKKHFRTKNMHVKCLKSTPDLLKGTFTHPVSARISALHCDFLLLVLIEQNQDEL